MVSATLTCTRYRYRRGITGPRQSMRGLSTGRSRCQPEQNQKIMANDHVTNIRRRLQA